MDKANEEAQRLHRENPGGPPNHAKAGLFTEINWDSNESGLPLLEHYERRILEGPKKGVPKQESLNMEQAVQKPRCRGSDRGKIC